MRTKIEHNIGSGETYMVYDDGTKKRIICYDIKIQDEFSEFRTYFWPKKKSDRKKVREHFKNTNEILGELNQQ